MLLVLDIPVWLRRLAAKLHKPASRVRPLAYAAALAGVGAAYFGAAKFGLMFAFTAEQVTTIWPPTGIALAAILLIGYRIWPAILLGAFAANATLDQPLLTAAAIAVGNTLAPLTGAFLLKRLAGFRNAMARVRDAVWLVILGAAAAMVISASNGATNLLLAGAQVSGRTMTWAEYPEVWWIWWIGDALGVIVIAPLILSWVANPRVELRGRQLAELALLFGTLAATCLIVLTGSLPEIPPIVQQKYVLFPWVIWMAFRFGQKGTSVVVVLIVAFAVYGAVNSKGPFTTGTLDERLIRLDLFVAAVAITGLVMGAASAERYRGQIRFQQAFENSPVAKVITDSSGLILQVNSATLELFGYAGHELVGRDVDRLVPPRFLAGHRRGRAEYMMQPRYLRFPAGRELYGLHKDGREIPVEIGLSPLSEAEGLRVLVTLVDLSERRRLEHERRELQQRVQHAQKLESLGVLAGGIAHDFNNLLMAIKGNTDLALMKSPPEAPAHVFLEQIDLATRRAADLTRQMLAYSGKGKLQVRHVNLTQAVEEMAHLLVVAVTKKAVLTYNFARDLPPIDADPSQISQVIMNLITNASDAIGERSGVIAVSTGLMEADKDYLQDCIFDGAQKQGDYVYFEVADTGAGMDEQTRARMFEPFFTTKFTGRGLGLAAVLGIVRSHRGTIRVFSEPGHGTTIRVLFPPSTRPISDRKSSAESAPWRGEGTVLVVDDEDSVRAVTRLMLQELGFEVVTAADGMDAIEQLKQHAGKISAVVLDMTMPRMGGREAFEQMRKVKPGVRVILSSGYSEQDALTAFGDGDLAGFLHKPYSPQQLAEVLRKALGQ